jgi:hypothetical protein
MIISLETGRLQEVKGQNHTRPKAFPSPTTQPSAQQILHAHIHPVLPRNCRGRRCRKEGRKACVSVSMKSSHQDIVATHLKNSLLRFLHQRKGVRSSKMATPKLWKVSAEPERLNPSSISTHEPRGQGSSSREDD